MLGELVKNILIEILKSADARRTRELKDLVGLARKLRMNKNFMNGYNASTAGLRVNLPERILTEEELNRAKEVFGVRLNRGRNVMRADADEDEDWQFFNEEEPE